YGERHHLLRKQTPSGDLIGIPAQQYAQFVLLLNHLTFQIRRARRGIRPLRIELIKIQLWGHALPEAGSRYLYRVLPRLERALGDVPLHVQLTKIEIGLSHAADERQNYGTTVLLSCQQVTARRLIRAADPAPDIQLPVQVPLQIVARECGEAWDV